jgi:hypothetical protein
MLPFQSDETFWMRWKEPPFHAVCCSSFLEVPNITTQETRSSCSIERQRGTRNCSGCAGVRIYSQGNNSFNVTVREPNLCRRQKHEANTGGSTDFETLGSQRRFNLIDGGDSIGSVSDRYGGVLLASIAAEQQDLLAVEGVFRPSKI